MSDNIDETKKRLYELDSKILDIIYNAYCEGWYDKEHSYEECNFATLDFNWLKSESLKYELDEIKKIILCYLKKIGVLI